MLKIQDMRDWPTSVFVDLEIIKIVPFNKRYLLPLNLEIEKVTSPIYAVQAHLILNTPLRNTQQQQDRKK